MKSKTHINATTCHRFLLLTIAVRISFNMSTKYDEYRMKSNRKGLILFSSNLASLSERTLLDNPLGTHIPVSKG